MSDRTELLNQIRRRLNVIAVASVAVACFVGFPYAVVVVATIASMFQSRDGWLWVLLGGLILASTFTCIALYAAPRPPRDQAGSTRPQ